jgi:hypothetical protein
MSTIATAREKHEALSRLRDQILEIRDHQALADSLDSTGSILMRLDSLLGDVESELDNRSHPNVGDMIVVNCDHMFVRVTAIHPDDTITVEPVGSTNAKYDEYFDTWNALHDDSSVD